jgi:hypothetical protein
MQANGRAHRPTAAARGRERFIALLELSSHLGERTAAAAANAIGVVERVPALEP